MKIGDIDNILAEEKEVLTFGKFYEELIITFGVFCKKQKIDNFINFTKAEMNIVYDAWCQFNIKMNKPEIAYNSAMMGLKALYPEKGISKKG